MNHAITDNHTGRKSEAWTRITSVSQKLSKCRVVSRQFRDKQKTMNKHRSKTVQESCLEIGDSDNLLSIFRFEYPKFRGDFR